MIIRIQSADGTKRVEVKPTDSSKALYEQVQKAFQLTGSNFALYQERDKKAEVVSSPRKTLKMCKLNHGDMLYLSPIIAFPKASTVPSSEAPSSEARVAGGGVKLGEGSGLKLGSGAKPAVRHRPEPTPGTSSRLEPAPKATPKATGGTDNGRQGLAGEGQVATSIKSTVTEDEVDQLLAKESGLIERKKNQQFCRHGRHSKCVHCIPMDPWDEGYMKEQNIKHMSFTSYLRKLTSGVDKGKFVALENINCKIKAGCRDHPPWPRGICSKCQPSAITLNRQSYRHVDNVVFENPNLVERFLNYWRVTGHQRLGFLYGHYEPHLDVPLGIKATVCAVYEPPQEGSRDHVKLLPDPKKDIVDEIARGLGLTCVGWIFTDLVPLDSNNGTVRHLRHADTHFLSAHEVITAAHLQSLHPNPCSLAPSGYYGSKFVTVIVTGDKDNQVHMEGYQVSNQCQSVVADKCLIPTKDTPELAYIRESTAEQYVPDVYFKEKDQYNNEVVRLGRPLPVEYLLLDCPVSTPKDPLYTFAINAAAFPVANRLVDGHLQDFPALATYLQKFSDDQFLEAVSDFHVLLFITTMDMLPLREYMGPLLEAVKRRDRSAALEWKKSEHWATVEQLVMASGGNGGELGGADGGSSAAGVASSVQSSSSSTSWTCQHCTFINQTASENCEMCHLPR